MKLGDWGVFTGGLKLGWGGGTWEVLAYILEELGRSTPSSKGWEGVGFLGMACALAEALVRARLVVRVRAVVDRVLEVRVVVDRGVLVCVLLMRGVGGMAVWEGRAVLERLADRVVERLLATRVGARLLEMRGVVIAWGFCALCNSRVCVGAAWVGFAP